MRRTQKEGIHCLYSLHPLFIRSIPYTRSKLCTMPCTLNLFRAEKNQIVISMHRIPGIAIHSLSHSFTTHKRPWTLFLSFSKNIGWPTITTMGSNIFLPSAECSVPYVRLLSMQSNGSGHRSCKLIFIEQTVIYYSLLLDKKSIFSVCNLVCLDGCCQPALHSLCTPQVVAPIAIAVWASLTNQTNHIQFSFTMAHHHSSLWNFS